MKKCILASRKKWPKSNKPAGERVKETRKVIRENPGLTSWQIAEKLGYYPVLLRLLKHKVIRFTQQPHPECGCRHQRYYEVPSV